MPAARLTQAIADIASRAASATTLAVRQGTVAAVLESGYLTVRDDATETVVSAKPVTDEPMLAGRRVWIVQAVDGTVVVLGSVR